MPRLITRCALAVALTCSSGCATIFANGPTTLNVDATANGKDVTIVLKDAEGRRVSTSRQGQAQFKLQRGTRYVVEVRAPGYQTGNYPIERTLEPVMLLNTAPLGMSLLTLFFAVLSGISPAPGPRSYEGFYLVAAAFGLLGGSGFLIDAITGNAWRHERDSLGVLLYPAEK